MHRFPLALSLLLLFLPACGAPPVAFSVPRDSTATPPATAPGAALFGTVYADSNGNGSRDADEPVIPNARIAVGDLLAVSRPDGTYRMAGAPFGEQGVQVGAAGFRYVSLSTADFRPVGEPVLVEISGETRRDWGLMQGPLTLPYPPGLEIHVATYEDLDPAQGTVRDWRGTTTPRGATPWGTPNTVVDGHTGTDFAVGDKWDVCDVKVYAAAPGTVAEASGGGGKGGVIRILQPDGLSTAYGHVGTVVVTVGQKVLRGQLLGATTCGWDTPHLHLELLDTVAGKALPIFRDPANPDAVGYWTKENDPQFANAYGE